MFYVQCHATGPLLWTFSTKELPGWLGLVDDVRVKAAEGKRRAWLAARAVLLFFVLAIAHAVLPTVFACPEVSVLWPRSMCGKLVQRPAQRGTLSGADDAPIW